MEHEEERTLCEISMADIMKIREKSKSLYSYPSIYSEESRENTRQAILSIFRFVMEKSVLPVVVLRPGSLQRMDSFEHAHDLHFAYVKWEGLRPYLAGRALPSVEPYVEMRGKFSFDTPQKKIHFWMEPR